MKKLIPYILLILVAACAQEELPMHSYYSPQDIFDAQGAVIKDASLVEINLQSSGEYILSLEDEFTCEVVTKELFIGKEGVNTLYVFTKVVPKGSYLLTLKDSKGNNIQQTKLSI